MEPWTDYFWLIFTLSSTLSQGIPFSQSLQKHCCEASDGNTKSCVPGLGGSGSQGCLAEDPSNLRSPQLCCNAVASGSTLWLCKARCIWSGDQISSIQWSQWHSVVAVGQPKINGYCKVCDATKKWKEDHRTLMQNTYFVLANSFSWILDAVAISLLNGVQIIALMHGSKTGCIGKKECTLEVLEDEEYIQSVKT